MVAAHSGQERTLQAHLRNARGCGRWSWFVREAHVSLKAARGGGCLDILYMGRHPERSAPQSAHTEAERLSQDSNPSPAVCTNPSGPGCVLLGWPARARLTLTALGWALEPRAELAGRPHPPPRKQPSRASHPTPSTGRQVEGAEEPGHSASHP